MDIFMEILGELLSEVFDLLISSSKVPKPLRYLIVTAVAGFIIALGVILGIQSDTLVGRIFCVLLATLGIAAEIYLVRKIHRS